MNGGATLGPGIAEWIAVWAAVTGGLLALALVTPLDRWTTRVGHRLTRVDASAGGAALLCVALASLAALFRLPFLEADPPADLLTVGTAFATDEGIWSHLATSWCLAREPLGDSVHLVGALALPFTPLQWAACQLGGVSLSAVRVVPALCGIAMAPALYLAARRWLGVGIALTAACLIATSFPLTMYQRTGMVDGLVAALGVGVLGLWVQALRGDRHWSIGAGLLLGLTIWIKLSATVLVGGVIAATWAANSVSRRDRGIRLGLAAAGATAVACVALVVYAAMPWLGSAASDALASNLHPPPLNPLHWATRLLQAVARDTSFVHTPLLMTLALGGLVGSAFIVRSKLRVPPGIAFAGGWWLSNIVLLADYGQVPTRFTLQTVAPTLLIALFVLRSVWTWVGGQTWSRRRVRAAIVAVVAAELLFGAIRFAAWLPQRHYTQRDVGAYVGALSREDTERPRISGACSFNLALSGHFEPTAGDPQRALSVEEALSQSVTHLLTWGPIPTDQLPPAELAHLRLRGRFVYYTEEFSPRTGLHLYAIDAPVQ